MVLSAMGRPNSFFRASLHRVSGSSPERRHCYLRSSFLEVLLADSRAVSRLMSELGVEPPPAHVARSPTDELEALRQRAIHLSVTDSPFRGLSVEEILVLGAFSATLLFDPAWRRALGQEQSHGGLLAACRAWLGSRVVVCCAGGQFGKHRWPLVGFTSAAPDAVEAAVMAVVPISNAAAIATDLDQLVTEGSFANELYLACSPGVALHYLYLHAELGGTFRWDTRCLDQRLKRSGVGLIVVDPDGATLHLPARHDPSPAGAADARAFLRHRSAARGS
jgi:hypothetical protein